jgi:hypothetical protein
MSLGNSAIGGRGLAVLATGVGGKLVLLRVV